MKNKTKIFALLLIILTLAACRYDEGPMLSFRTVENRVAQDFELVEFTKDGVDMTQELTDSVGKNWSFLTSYQASPLDHNLKIYPDTSLPNVGYFDISSNKKNIEIMIYGCIYGYSYVGIEPFKSNISTIWKIERLTKDEMWLSCTYNDADYYLKLEADED